MQRIAQNKCYQLRLENNIEAFDILNGVSRILNKKPSFYHQKQDLFHDNLKKKYAL